MQVCAAKGQGKKRAAQQAGQAQVQLIPDCLLRLITAVAPAPLALVVSRNVSQGLYPPASCLNDVMWHAAAPYASSGPRE